MIPEFPHFKNLEFSDKEEVECVTHKYSPYSDFNFISMWSYDTKNEMEISKLGKNLIVKFTDYVTEDPFYSFIGCDDVNGTSQKLIKLSEENSISPVLKLIPEEVVKNLDKASFKVDEDPDHLDYIVSIDRLLPHDGKERKLSSRRLLINKFKEDNKIEIRIIDAHDRSVQEQIMQVFNVWEGELKIREIDIGHLRTALSRLFSIKELKPTISFGLFINDKFSGYSINEILPNGYALGHFQQADLRQFKGAYALLMQEVAPYLSSLGCKYINLEQDLGIGGLRTWKKSYNPAFFLKKYTVSSSK